MATDTDAPSKRAAPPIRYFYLDEQMSTGKLIETLEGLHFNSQGLCRINVDEGTRNYLLRATRAAGGDPDIKVRHAWRLIKPRGGELP